MRVMTAFLVSLIALVLGFPTAPTSAAAAPCQVVLGFKVLHDLIPDVVGACLVDEHHNPQNGDGLQETTGATGSGGLLVWRKADSWTGYTDGYRTWLNGPNGLQPRLNTQRFCWEADADPQICLAGATPPGQPALSTATDLDDEVSRWKIFLDRQGLPNCQVAQWEKGNTPISRDGTALRLAITGGDCYTHVQGYYDLPAVPDVTGLQLSFWYRFSPTTWNGAGGPSVVQALEFAVNSWRGNQRFECALQWENVGDATAQQGNPPTWRVWDGARKTWLDTGVTEQLAGDQWHSFELACDLRNGQVHYTRFVSDGVVHALDQTFAPAFHNEPPDRLSATIQLDADYREDPYAVILDRMTVSWGR